jgi:hypothetical protein
MADRMDKFKYWTSFRTEGIDYNSYTESGYTKTNTERGIANQVLNGKNYIDDAAPFVVYKNQVPTNRVVIKMQTNVGTKDLGPFTDSSKTFADPFYGYENQTTPVDWKVQVLKNNSWTTIADFNKTSAREDGSKIIKSDGYIELAYGLIVPKTYKDIFIKAEEYNSESMLPSESVNGYAYLIKTGVNDIGYYRIWVDKKSSYETFVPEYGWVVAEETVDRLTNFVTELVNPPKFVSKVDSEIHFREFEYISGIRIVAETMNKIDSTLDIIEISPRLTANLSDKTMEFSVTKSASDLGVSGMPVGQLLASTGSLSLFDYDQSFSENNSTSILYGYMSKNIQVKFYEIIVDVKGYDYFVPIKTLYSEGFPQVDDASRKVSLALRDMYFYFESMQAPQLLIQNASLSYAVALLMDSIGFSNYSIKRVSGEKELIIPYFFVGPDKTVAQVLQDLALSTQTAMFFDEYNNFVMMSKNYMMPQASERSSSFVLHGSADSFKDGVVKNKTAGKLANIVSVSTQQTNNFNDGKITYSSKYIQRSFGSIRQASLLDEGKTWIYKPALLWEVSGTQDTKSVNEVTANQSTYMLSAIPLNSDLSEKVPSVSNRVLKDNIMDFGEGIYWLSRYAGYFYANGEVIKYDAVEYSIPGIANNVWITSLLDYQNYFSKIPFNGKMYPTGKVRIYSEPNYEVVDGNTVLANGAVAKHGRGQFGTSPVYHSAGLNEYWTNNDNIQGCQMNSDFLFGSTTNITLTGANSSGNVVTVTNTSTVSVGQAVTLISGTGQLNSVGTTTVTAKTNTTITLSKTPDVALSGASLRFETVATAITGAAGIDNVTARQTSRTGIIKNFLSNNFVNETTLTNLKTVKPGTIQSSAFVMTGPSFDTKSKPINFVSYVHKNLSEKYTHFGTRMRIIGMMNNDINNLQTPIGSTPYTLVPGLTPDKNTIVGGASGGLAVMVNPKTNNGYFFEIIALTDNNVNSYSNTAKINNVMFYKVMKDANTGEALPVKLYEGFASILVDDGRFTGQYRMTAEQNPTVYDLAVEYLDIGSTRRFFLYINGNIIATVDDESPLPKYNNMALFVRGSARCMFENIYAITNNYSQNTGYALDVPSKTVFGDSSIDMNESFRKYAISGIIQSTYLSSLTPQDAPKYKIYFEEFGTIMREAAYFNIKYDKAYPALLAKMSPTFNRVKGYTVSGFTAGAYGAEFMVFNATDSALSLDETTGNYLRIQGVTFTQESNHELTVDEFYTKLSDQSNPQIGSDSSIISPIRSKQDFEDIKLNRLTYGKKEFSLSVPYIQSQDAANELMSWMTSKIMKPRKSIGVDIFAIPTLQLGDIVSINYVNESGKEPVASSTSRFVIYNIQYSKSHDGPKMTVYLSEVL